MKTEAKIRQSYTKWTNEAKRASGVEDISYAVGRRDSLRWVLAD